MLNRNLCQFNANRIGTLLAAPTASWEAGQVAKIGATGVDVAGTTDTPLGILANNHKDAITRAIYAEAHGPVDYAEAGGATRSVSLAHTNLVTASYAVYAGSTLLVENTDYTINTSTGIITAVASGKLDSVNGTYTNGGMITVNYRYLLTVAEKSGFLDVGGQIVGGPGIDNNFDDVLPTGQTTVLLSGNVVFTDQFDTSAAWTTPGVKVYADSNGRLTPTQTGSQEAVGIVISVPTANSPWLGIVVL